ncbi:SAP domain-containing protein [Jiangella alkaliphila]|uniref:SAP domain-containing protein n=1 Tax=Jiangella alkaliphila TaxID=419479 RepID=A0A1H2IEL7_9ACTN|nr:SAP domain-containing protein [Jiangella alkaliphila]SDU42542.1 SAP domain-containing protein [Jiangella alkaliphila]
MTIWLCRRCTARFAVGLAACPQCGSVIHHEEGADMPGKTTRHGGGTTANLEVVTGDFTVDEAAAAAVASAAPSPFDTLSADELKSACEARGLAKSGSKPKLIARLVEHDAQHPGDLGAEVTAGGDADEVVDELASEYDVFDEDVLRAECAERELPTDGDKAQLVARLVEHDAAQAAEQAAKEAGSDGDG